MNRFLLCVAICNFLIAIMVARALLYHHVNDPIFTMVVALLNAASFGFNLRHGLRP